MIGSMAPHAYSSFLIWITFPNMVCVSEANAWKRTKNGRKVQHEWAFM